MMKFKAIQPIAPRSPVRIRVDSAPVDNKPISNHVTDIHLEAKASVIGRPKRESIPNVTISSIERPDIPDISENVVTGDVRAVDSRPRLLAAHVAADNTRETDLNLLKAMTNRLNLSTQRPSYIEWRAQYVDKPSLIKTLQNGVQNISSQPWTQERKYEINQALEWLKNELIDMRNQDQSLARQLVSLRADLHSFKLEKFCDEHKMAIEDARDEIEEEDELSELCDSPLSFGAFSARAPLKMIGVTRMNLERRRFSMC